MFMLIEDLWNPGLLHEEFFHHVAGHFHQSDNLITFIKKVVFGVICYDHQTFLEYETASMILWFFTFVIKLYI